MTRNQFRKQLREVCRRCGKDLEEKGMKVFDKMTGDERSRVTRDDQHPYRLAKGVLVAIVANGLIDRQWNAEGLKRDVRMLRKIERRYA